MSRVLLLLLVWLLAGTQVAFAHEVRPAYLELRQTDPDTYAALWKVPGNGDTLRLRLQVELPKGTHNVSVPRIEYGNGAFIERWRIQRPGGLTGGTLRIGGLSATMTDVLVRVERLDGTTQIARLNPAQSSFVIESAPANLQVASTYLVLGVEHILTGIDHLLFVLALVILVAGARRLFWTITAFTAAHSITLAAAALGWVHVPPPPVEASIALSIVFLASEIMHARAGRPGLTYRQPWIVAFLFGLLHGLGFAGALSEVGLPENAIPTALLFFNVGVEIGQLLFIAVVLAVMAGARRFRLPRSDWTWRLPVYAIGTIAAFWTIERVVAF